MQPPCYVKGVHIKNTTDHNICILVSFGTEEQAAEGHAKIQEEKQLAPQEEIQMDEKEFDMGTWTAIAPFTHLEVKALDSLQGTCSTNEPHLFQPQVNQIVNLLHVEIRQSTQGTFQVHQLDTRD
jgi:hypothetical protein